MSGRIRVLALVVVRRGDELLVEDGEDPVKGERYYRLLGGGVEFGERGADAVRRELQEEIGTELAGVSYLGAVENLFTFLGEPGHEVCLLYEASFAESALYERDGFEGVDMVGGVEVPVRAHWVHARALRDGGLPLYPDGALELITAKAP